MRKQFIGVILLMMGMDNLYNLKDSGVALADFTSGQWAALIVSIVMVALGLYLGIVGWLEWRKVMEEREKEKKAAEEKFKNEVFGLTEEEEMPEEEDPDLTEEDTTGYSDEDDTV